MQPFSLLVHTALTEGEQHMQHIVKERKQKARRLANSESNNHRQHIHTEDMC